MPNDNGEGEDLLLYENKFVTLQAKYDEREQRHIDEVAPAT